MAAGGPIVAAPMTSISRVTFDTAEINHTNI